MNERNMKKAIVIGGANGIGLAIVHQLKSRHYIPIVLDLVKPKNIECEYYYFDMLEINEDLLTSLSKDLSINFLVITAGIGRVCSFENLHPAEIYKLMMIDSVSTLKIFRYFYERINNEKNFYIGVMGSIAGLISSPLFAVYAAAKASIFRFVESVNVELEKNGTLNRISNISPGSIKGTSFNGESTNLMLIDNLASEIIENILKRTELFIPKYKEIYKNVINKYNSDSKKYGIYSYEYKINSNRFFNEKKVRIGYMSGTFDLFHIGHLNIIKHAKNNCDYLIVGVHKDASHKGKETFIPFNERMAIVGACKYVDKVVPSMAEDSDAVFKYGANRLFVGSDYKGTKRFKKYEKLFTGKNIKIVYFPYTKGTSSTQIREYIINNSKDIKG